MEHLNPNPNPKKLSLINQLKSNESGQNHKNFEKISLLAVP
jgi:hypothetical protein